MPPHKSLLILAVGFAAPSALGQSPTYHLTDLGTLGGLNSYASATNSTAAIAGFSAYDLGGDFHAFTFSNGAIVDLGTLGGTNSYAYGLNSSGLTVGTAYVSGDVSAHAFQWAAGVLTDLGTLGGSMSDAYAVNDSGTVVGDASLFGDLASHAFESSGNGLVDLGTLGGTNSVAFGVNASGTVVGSSDTASGQTHAFAFGVGMLDLGTLGGDFSSAVGVNAGGVVTGSANLVVGGPTHAFTEFNGVMADLGTLGGDYSSADAINDLGQVVGVASVTGDISMSAFISANGVMQDLNGLLDGSGHGFAVTEGFAIDNRCYIAANASTVGGNTHAVLLTPYYTLAPTGLSIYRGVVVSGSLASLAAADQQYLRLLTGLTLSPADPPVSIIVTAVSPVTAQGDLRLSVVGHTNTVGISETVELWDFAAGAWASVTSRAATVLDSTLVGIATAPSRFTQPATGAVKARISWKQTGLTTVNRWSVAVDQVAWTITP